MLKESFIGLKERENEILVDYLYHFEISFITIYGLFGDISNKVEVDFEKNVQIFTGENGTGKTTILNIIYNTLKGNSKALYDLPFDLIILEFKNGKSLLLKREWFSKTQINLNDLEGTKFTKLMLDFLSISYDAGERGENKERSNNLRRIKRSSYNHFYIFDKLSLLDKELLDCRIDDEKLQQEYLGDDTLDYHYSNIEELDIEYIEEYEMRIALYYYILLNFYKENIIYFPTYRRIEEELYDISEKKSSLYRGVGKELLEKKDLISFGLSDVAELIESIENEIKDFSLEGYSQINTQLLSYMLSPAPITDKMIQKINDEDIVNIVLSRMEGNTLKTEEKDILKNKLNNINALDKHSETDKVIIYFIYKLIERYEMKSEREEAIKTFVEVCNKYLVNKYFDYNQSKIKIEVLNNETGEEIKLKNLSSGEKQIVAAFSKFILKDSSSSIVILDEPELSLSVEWQMMFLPDILKYSGCTKLIAVTHSPFTYRNNLKKYARSLNSIVSKLEIKEDDNFEEFFLEESENDMQKALERALINFREEN